MTLGDILDGVFKLLRANAGALAPVLLLVALPFEVLIAYGSRNTQSITQLLAHLGTVQNRTYSISVNDAVLEYGGYLGLLIATPVVAGAVCRTVAASYLGEQLRAAQVAKAGTLQVFALLAASVLGHLLELAGFFLCFLPGVAVAALLFLAAPAIVLEGLGPVEGLRRSWRLVKRRFWPVLGTVVLGVFLGGVVVNIISVLPDIVGLLAPPHVRAVLEAVVGTAGNAFEWAFAGILATLVYFDQRMRQEGFDLAVMAARLR